MGRRDRARPDHVRALTRFCSRNQRPTRSPHPQAAPMFTVQSTASEGVAELFLCWDERENRRRGEGSLMKHGFVVGRIYQIRRYELERGFTLPPTAHIPRP